MAQGPFQSTVPFDVTDNTTGNHFLSGLNASYDLSRVGTSAISYDTLGRTYRTGVPAVLTSRVIGRELP